MKPIAFIIITYNRPGDTLALLKNIAGLERAEELLEEIIIVNNASQANYEEVKAFIGATSHLPFRYYDAPENLGVARGRNYALQLSHAPVCIMIDDDAELGNTDCLIKLLQAFEQQEGPREKAIVSFKVLYYETRNMQENAFPHKRFKEYHTKHEFLTYYYAGGAHAILRSALNKVGLYPEDFFYGMEEYDLSYRLLNAGYSIAYSDSIIMLHKESPLGRKPQAEKMRMLWINKSTVAYRYLPYRYFISTGLMWSLEYLRKSGWQWSGFWKGWKAFLQISARNKRTPVSPSTLQYLRETRARLWY